MSEFLSEEWFEAIEAHAVEASAPEALELTVEQIIEGTPPIRWQIQIAGGSVTVDRNPTTTADIRVITDLDTATAIQAGATSAQRAFLDGSLRIGGDVHALMEHRQVLIDLAPALGVS